MDRNNPLISCICVTRNKPHLLMRAIDCFIHQTYPNKELIVLYEEDDPLTHAFFTGKEFGPSIRPIRISVSVKLKLGHLRNIAIDRAMGDYICQWDDDDWYHIYRLEHQYAALHNNYYKASIMTQWLVFDSTRGNAYISNRRLWEGSIMCCREAMKQVQYAEVERGEDTVVIDYLKSQDYIWEINDKANMYIYIYHSGNTWHESHWNKIFHHSQQLPPECSAEIGTILGGKYSVEEGSFIIDELLRQI
jgi:glycosyltransferase involved in cell wall biosynthesis